MNTAWATEDMIDGVRYYRTGAVNGRRRSFFGEWCLIRRLQQRIRAVAYKEQPQILHAHSPVLNSIPAIIVGRELGIPVVYEIRAFWEDAAVDHGSYRENSWKYLLVRFIETWACHLARQVTVICRGLKNDLVKRGISSQKITPVFNGVDAKNFRPCPVDEEFAQEWKLSGKKIVGFIGSFYRYEGLDLLVRAFSHAASRNPDLVLLLVGAGEMTKELKELVEFCRLSERVVMPGRVPHIRIPGIYALVDVMTYPRYSMRLTELVTPLKPLEAMATGKALVASDVGGHKEQIQHNETGLLFPAGDLQALTAAIEKLLFDDVLVQRLQNQGAKWVKNNRSWEKTTLVYQNIYERALRS